MTFAALLVTQKRDKGKEFLFFFKKDSSSVTLRATPSTPVSATPTEFAPQIGQFPTEEGWQNALPPSAHPLYPRPPTYICGRADNACTNLLGYFVRYVRTRGIAEAVGSGKATDFRPAPLPHILATHGSRD